MGLEIPAHGDQAGMGLYTKQYYERKNSRRSAQEIIPIVLELVQPPQVIDVGYRLGTWLSVFKKYGIDDIGGVDDSWADKEI